MRILVASDQWFPDYKGGSARVAAEVARGLAERGHDLTVVVPYQPHLPREERSDERLSVLRVLRRRVLPQTIADVVESGRHARRLRGSTFDVALAHQTTVAVGLGASLDVPLALVYHASAPRELRFLRERATTFQDRARHWALTVPIRLFDARAVAAARSILTLSAYTDSLLAVDHPEALTKVARVSGGVDTSWFCPADSREEARKTLGVGDQPLLVTVRRLEPRMGIERLLEALSLLRDGEPRLAVVGEGTLRHVLERRAQELGVAGRVDFVGLVDETELRDWYRAADVVVLPTIAYEGFGLATAEALACGSPVVGTPVGATPELLAPLDPRLVARGTSPAELAEAVAGALAFGTADFRSACREYAASTYSWPRVVPSWETVLAAAALQERRPAARMTP